MGMGKIQNFMDVITNVMIDSGISISAIKGIIKACQLDDQDLDYLGLSWIKYYREH